MTKTLVLLGTLVFTLVSCGSKKATFLTTDTIQLAPPKILVDSLLFKNGAKVKIDFDLGSAQVRYTTDGSMVTEEALLYTAPLTLNKTTRLMAKAFYPNYKSSEIQKVSIRKIKQIISSAKVAISPEPNENYTAQGPSSLTDQLKGTTSFRNGAYWLGFQTDTILIELKLAQPISAENLIVSTLQDQDSWIFYPAHITVSSAGEQIGSLELTDSHKAGSKKMDFITVPINKKAYHEFRVLVMPLTEIPDWHAGKGTVPWTFVDEIMIE
ncbi:chitobiase/beta-hexosaminidase C-terminal domain-containing protein [Spongiimicrobium sp. 3-5]|uniref:chitobiase/beta-hexosaminidase C-terminal domain-containing protein n=1 Tax=Spongiimicrobium sp. 3-5 TaxID=3332596 RepID=UPI00397F4286